MAARQEIWDEFRWERLIREQDRLIERHMELMYLNWCDSMRGHAPAMFINWRWLIEEAMGPNEEGTEEGEDWKIASGFTEEESPGPCPYTFLPARRLAREFASRALKFADLLPENVRLDSDVVDFVSNALIASAMIGSGNLARIDSEWLGHDIAYCKRSLAASNLALTALRVLGRKGMVDGSCYRTFAMDATEVRDAVAVHILDLREAFYRNRV